MLNIILVPLYTDASVISKSSDYASIIILFAYIVFGNTFLSYGLETAFFRFRSKTEDKKLVFSTALQSIFWTTTLALTIALLFRSTISQYVGVNAEYVTYILWILALDAWVVIPFARLRAEGQATFFAFIKIFNVSVNIGLNLFFLLFLPRNFENNNFFQTIYFENYEVGYIFLANLLASLITFVILGYNYFFYKIDFSFKLWRNMLAYGFPILLSGLAFAINENLDKILLDKLGVDKSIIGAYGACYKLGIFMILFRTAYSLGIEPFFFSHSNQKHATQTYANVTKYFIIAGALFSLFIIINLDLFKHYFVRNEAYFSAIQIVPIIILANFFLGIYTNLSIWYKLIDKTYVGAIVSILGALITIGINLIFIPIYGYMASAVATIVTYAGMCLISYYWGQKKYPIPYDKAAIKLYLGLSTAFIFIYFYYFRENYWVGYGFLFILLATIFFRERDKFKEETKTIEEKLEEPEIILSNDSETN
jgi:O-antigen/teichoic acid export membrane protein